MSDRDSSPLHRSRSTITRIGHRCRNPTAIGACLARPFSHLRQGAAVYVPYTKKRKEWIIAAVSRWLPETREYVLIGLLNRPPRSCGSALLLLSANRALFPRYIVKDQFPDTRRKVDTWKVKEREVLRYPAPDDEVFNVNDKVLSLWMMETKEWSSMFYEAVVAAPAIKVCVVSFAPACLLHRIFNLLACRTTCSFGSQATTPSSPCLDRK